MKIVTVCGMGIGTSVLLKMNTEKALRTLGIDADVEAADIGTALTHYDRIVELPLTDPVLRAGIAERARQEGWPALHAELARVDPDSAARLHPNDSARIQRALEITRAGGAPASQRRGGGSRPSLGPLCVVRWQPYDRAALRERIAERFDAMLAAGLVDEVAALRARSDIHADLPSMRAVGYRQIWRHLDGELDREAARAAGIKATRLLAKRQSTWLSGGLVERALVREGDAVFNVRERADEIAVLSSCEQEVATRR